MRHHALALLAAITLTGGPAAAQLLGGGGGTAQPLPGIGSVTVSGNEVRATVNLSSTLTADLVLAFDNVVGLNLANLGLSAELVDPLDANLVSRLGGLALPAGFPVRLRIDPPTAGGLSFSGVYTLSLHTHALDFTVDCPLRLFTAHAGGPFEDMTETIGMGSYRARGTGGSFSEFLIVTDLRPKSSVAAAKFDVLEDLLVQHGGSIAPAVLDSLEDDVVAARAAWTGGSPSEAVRLLDQLAETVRAQSGAAIPDVWRASGDLVNVAGLLRSAASTLRFSINLGG